MAGETAGGIAARLPAARPALRGRVVAFARSEFAPFGLVVVVALVLRLVDLTAKPFHHDESEHAWFAWRLVTGLGYHYDPIFHGPVQFYLMSLSYLILGVGNFSARLAPALAGTVITGLPYLLRRRLGHPAALAAAVLLCISPSYLYFSRFAREDIYTACLTLGLIVTAFAFLARPRRWHPSLLLGLLAVSFATKETTYITVAIWVAFFGTALAWQLRRARSDGRPAPLLVTLRSVGRDAWIWGVATFVAVYTLLFTTFFTNPQGLEDGLYKSIHYWLSQQPVNRGGHPGYYYLIVLPAYEWPILLLGLVGAVAVARRPTLLGLFLIWDLVASFALYSAAGERMPWLVLHPLLPLVLLAGVGVDFLWQRRRAVAARVALAAGLAAAAWSVWQASVLAYGHPANPKEMLVFTQTATDVPPVVNRIASLARSTTRPKIEVDQWGGTGWPWGWYLRDVPTAYPDMSAADYKPTGDVLVVADPDQKKLAPLLKGYRAHRFRLRVWWVVDYGGGSAGDWLNWFVERRTWGSRGQLYEWIYVRKGIVASGADRRAERAARPRSGTPITMNGRKLSAWRTSAKDSARELSMP